MRSSKQIVLAFLIAAGGCTAATAQDLDLVGATVIDGTGAIRPGLEADLLVVERDPLRDGAALFEPLLVVSDGRVAFERSWLPPQ